MCGIAGFWSPRIDPSEAPTLLEAMASSLSHRGPDARGTSFDPHSGLGLAHSRLSIVDLSEHGNQPMVSRDGRYEVVFNGEIYNFLELRRQLEQRQHIFRGHSDTEVLLAAIVEWGLDGALDRFNGMFALVVWDAEVRKLHLTRDRVGEKPLYYARVPGGWAFGSELRALRVLPSLETEIDRDALALLVDFGYIPAPHSIYRNVRKLPAGQLLTLDQASLNAGWPAISPRRFWNARTTAEDHATTLLDGSPSEIADMVHEAVREAVQRRLVADVPIGAFLSGGVDSSLVVAVMQDLTNAPVPTFTLGFEEQEFDEAPHAQAIARHLGTSHTEMRVTASQTLDLVASIPTIFDEPFADPSQIPTYLIAQASRQEVSVVLSGDGGDELFGGYHRYAELERIWHTTSKIPAALRPALGRLLSQSPAPSLARHLPFRAAIGKANRLGRLLPSRSATELYRRLVSFCPRPRDTVRGTTEKMSLPAFEGPHGHPELRRQLMLIDFMGYLPEDVLTKVDRATMSVGLEGRLPLLDVDLVQLAWRIPIEHHQREGQTKWPLREALHRYIPKGLFERPKQGFELPLGDWLRGPLRPWVEDLLSASRLRQDGYFQPDIVRRRWQEHASGVRDWRFFLWATLMFQQWNDRPPDVARS